MFVQHSHKLLVEVPISHRFFMSDVMTGNPFQTTMRVRQAVRAYNPQEDGRCDKERRHGVSAMSQEIVERRLPPAILEGSATSRNEPFEDGLRACRWPGCGAERSTANTLSSHESNCGLKVVSADSRGKDHDVLHA